MATVGKNKYQATDYDFGNTVAILRIIYIAAIVIIIVTIVASMFGAGFVALRDHALGFLGMIQILFSGLAALVINYLWYSFAIVLFEIVKNLRQTRDEIMALRKVSFVNSAATQVNAEKQPSGSLRYDPNTHEYIKAQ